jgi:hypothetical protein
LYSENEIVDELVGKRKRDTSNFSYPAKFPPEVERKPLVSPSLLVDDITGEASSDAGSTTTPDSVAVYGKSASTTASSDQNPQKKGKKNPRKSNTSKSSVLHATITVIGPKIPAGDIRLSMMNIWIGGFNSCDPEIMSQYLAKYCVPDCLCMYKFVGTSNPHGPDNIELMGREAILSFWETTFKTCPDIVMNSFETKVRLSSTTGYCYSSCNFIFQCTKLQSWSVDNDYHFIAYNDAANASARMSSPVAVVSPSLLPLPPAVSFFPALGKEVTDEPSIVSSNVVCVQVPKSNPLDTRDDKLSESLLAVSLTNQAFGNDLPFPLVSSALINKAASDQQPTAITIGPAFEEPQKVIFVGTYTIYMNPDKKVYKMEIIHSIKQ